MNIAEYFKILNKKYRYIQRCPGAPDPMTSSTAVSRGELRDIKPGGILKQLPKGLIKKMGIEKFRSLNPLRRDK